MTATRSHRKSDKAVALKAFEVIGRQPFTWVEFAASHRFAANLVLAEFKKALEANKTAEETGVYQLGVTLQPIYMLLAGLSLENLLKGICLTNNPALIENGAIKKWPGPPHGLKELAVLAGFTVSDSEKALLKRLGDCINWYGRYPVPMKYDRPYPRDLVFESESDMVDWLTKDPPMIKDLFERMSKIVRQLEAKRKRVLYESSE